MNAIIIFLVEMGWLKHFNHSHRWYYRCYGAVPGPGFLVFMTKQHEAMAIAVSHYNKHPCVVYAYNIATYIDTI